MHMFGIFPNDYFLKVFTFFSKKLIRNLKHLVIMLLAYQSYNGNSICTTFMKEKQLSKKKLLYKSTWNSICVCMFLCVYMCARMCKLFKWYVLCVSYVFVCVWVWVCVGVCVCACVFVHVYVYSSFCMCAFIICRLHAYVCLMFNVCNCQIAQSATNFEYLEKARTAIFSFITENGNLKQSN
jgi:hypothetical protein